MVSVLLYPALQDSVGDTKMRSTSRTLRFSSTTRRTASLLKSGSYFRLCINTPPVLVRIYGVSSNSKIAQIDYNEIGLTVLMKQGSKPLFGRLEPESTNRIPTIS